MNRKGFKAFDKVKAEDGLKRRTSQYLHAQIRGREDGADIDTTGTGGKASVRADYWHAASRRARRRSRLGFAAAMMIVLALAGGMLYILSPRQEEAVAYVDMDVNPSIELALGRDGRVVYTGAYNPEGEGILANADIDGLAYADAVRALLDEMISAGYLAEGGLVSMTLQTEAGDEAAMLARLEEAVEAALRDGGAEAATEIFAVDGNTRQSAHDHNISPAKYIAISQLQEVDDTATYEGCAIHSISEIHHMTRTRRHGNHDDIVAPSPTEDVIPETPSPAVETPSPSITGGTDPTPSHHDEGAPVVTGGSDAQPTESANAPAGNMGSGNNGGNGSGDGSGNGNGNGSGNGNGQSKPAGTNRGHHGHGH